MAGAFGLIRSWLDPVTAAKINVMGCDRAEWEPVLKAAIEPDQLPEMYGGTRPNPDELQPDPDYIASWHSRTVGRGKVSSFTFPIPPSSQLLQPTVVGVEWAQSGGMGEIGFRMSYTSADSEDEIVVAAPQAMYQAGTGSHVLESTAPRQQQQQQQRNGVDGDGVTLRLEWSAEHQTKSGTTLVRFRVWDKTAEKKSTQPEQMANSKVAAGGCDQERVARSKEASAAEDICLVPPRTREPGGN